MSKRWDGLVPFRDGKMLEYTYYEPGEIPVNGFCAPTAWEKAGDFRATLEYMSYCKGRSAARFRFVDNESGREYSMPISAFDDVVRLLKDGIVSGLWRLGKQGANYGLYYVGP